MNTFENKKKKYKKLRLAIIGCGNIAKFHIKSFKKLGVNICHCASSLNSKTVSQFAKEHKIKNLWSDPFKLAKASDLWDGLILSSKTESIPKLLDILIKQKKPILVEKPVSIGTKYLKKFKNSANDLVQVGYNRRYYPTILKAKEFIDNSKGQILCKMILPENINNNKNRYKKFRKIFENSSHGIDLLYYLFGKLKIKHISKIKLNSFDSARSVILTNTNKHTCILIVNSNSPDNFSLELEDGQKRLLIQPFEKLQLYKGLKKEEPSQEYPLRKYSPNLIESKNIFQFQKKYKDIKPGFFNQSYEFVNLILKKKIYLAANLKDAYNAQKLLEDIMLS